MTSRWVVMIIYRWEFGRYFACEQVSDEIRHDSATALDIKSSGC